MIRKNAKDKITLILYKLHCSHKNNCERDSYSLLKRKVLCQTGRVWTSRPAKGGGRSVKKETDSNTNVIWICVCVYIRCSTAMLFTCTSVLNCPVGMKGWAWNLSRWGEQQDTGRAKTNKKIAHETEQQKPHFNPELRAWRMYSRGAPRRWPFKYIQNHSDIIML
jgi:hypothetical protein